jgi:hypothetical protein
MRKQWRKQKKDEQDKLSAQATYASLVAAGAAPDIGLVAVSPPRGSIPAGVRISTGSSHAHPDLTSPVSIGYPSGSDYSPIDTESPRMSLPNIAASHGVSVNSPHHASSSSPYLSAHRPEYASRHDVYATHSARSEYAPVPAASMGLPSLSLSSLGSNHESWLPQQQAMSVHGSPSQPEYVPRSDFRPDFYARPDNSRPSYGMARQYGMVQVPQSAPPHQLTFNTHGDHAHTGLPDPISVSQLQHEEYTSRVRYFPPECYAIQG